MVRWTQRRSAVLWKRYAMVRIWPRARGSCEAEGRPTCSGIGNLETLVSSFSSIACSAASTPTCATGTRPSGHTTLQTCDWTATALKLKPCSTYAPCGRVGTYEKCRASRQLASTDVAGCVPYRTDGVC